MKLPGVHHKKNRNNPKKMALCSVTPLVTKHYISRECNLTITGSKIEMQERYPIRKTAQRTGRNNHSSKHRKPHLFQLSLNIAPPGGCKTFWVYRLLLKISYLEAYLCKTGDSIASKDHRVVSDRARSHLNSKKQKPHQETKIAFNDSTMTHSNNGSQWPRIMQKNPP